MCADRRLTASRLAAASYRPGSAAACVAAPASGVRRSPASWRQCRCGPCLPFLPDECLLVRLRVEDTLSPLRGNVPSRCSPEPAPYASTPAIETFIGWGHPVTRCRTALPCRRCLGL